MNKSVEVKSVEAKYAAVLDYSNNALALKENLFERLTSEKILNPGNFKLSRPFSKANLLYERNTDETRNIYYAIATEDQKRNPLFSILMTDFPTERLAYHMKEQLALEANDVENLIKIHKLTIKKLTVLNFKAIFGALLVGAGLLLNSVPEAVIDYIGWWADYATYQITVFIAMLVILSYCALVLFPLWYKYSKAKRQHEFCETLLAYCEIIGDSGKDARSSDSNGS